MNITKTQKIVFWILMSLSISALIIIFIGKQNNSDLQITVYKSPTCGCCSKWVTHLESNGFTVQSVNTPNIRSIKEEYGIPSNLASCHTATVNGYLIEGHVPAKDIQRLLQERPKVKGIAVPGMPVGSPGMEEAGKMEPYNVVTFTAQGMSGVYESH